jgi:hypothetical protein
LPHPPSGSPTSRLRLVAVLVLVLALGGAVALPTGSYPALLCVSPSPCPEHGPEDFRFSQRILILVAGSAMATLLFVRARRRP